MYVYYTLKRDSKLNRIQNETRIFSTLSVMNVSNFIFMNTGGRIRIDRD